MNAVGIVLAGGLSRRFGSPKAFAKLEEKYFYNYAVEALTPFCDEIVIVTRQELVDRFVENEQVITDMTKFSGLGPLAGILSAMEFVEADCYVVLPCDMPHVHSGVIQGLIDAHENGVTAVISGERQHPLVSVWSRETKTLLRKSLECGKLRVLPLLEEIGTTWIAGNRLTEHENLVFTNVNTIDVLERGKESGSNTRQTWQTDSRPSDIGNGSL